MTVPVYILRILRITDMNCLENENVCSVKKENNLGYYRLHTIWRKDGFFINVTSKNGSWRGEMTPSDVAKMSTQLEMEPETYMNQCKRALTHHGGQPGMAYAVEDGSFTWKKVEDEDSGIKIKMGSVMLEPTNFVDTIQNLVTAALNCNQNLQERLQKLTEENRTVLESRTELLSKLQELTKTKETMEKDLYSRFILLINAKKRKISELENLLDEKYKKHNTSPKKIENPYEIDTDTDSEEEPTINSSNKAGKKCAKSIPKKVRKNNVLPLDVPEEKKLKNTNEVVANFGCSNDIRMTSPKPSTSMIETENQEGVTDKTSLTKDELYDYFYGEL